MWCGVIVEISEFPLVKGGNKADTTVKPRKRRQQSILSSPQELKIASGIFPDPAEKICRPVNNLRSVSAPRHKPAGSGSCEERTCRKTSLPGAQRHCSRHASACCIRMEATQTRRRRRSRGAGLCTAADPERTTPTASAVRNAGNAGNAGPLMKTRRRRSSSHLQLGAHINY